MPVYKHGLPFEPVLAENLRNLQERIRKKKAALIIIDGGVGEGKTTLMIEVLDYINQINSLPPIEFDGPQIAMGGADFLKKMRLCHEKNLPCIGYDEAGDYSKRSSLTQFNAMINRTFETFRAFKCLVVLSLPNFNILDSQLFDNRIPRMLIHLQGRTEKWGHFHAYGMSEMLWLRYWMKKLPLKDYAFSKVYPNFSGAFLDLDKERSAALDKVSTKNKIEVLKKSEVKIEGLMTYPELAVKLGMSLSWTRQTANILKIKPVRRIHLTSYFNEEALNQLSSHIDNTSGPGRPRTRGI